MQALVDSHLFVHNIKPRELFRSAYMYKFHRPITEEALTEDVDGFTVQGKIPPYVTNYMIAEYGVH